MWCSLGADGAAGKRARLGAGRRRARRPPERLGKHNVKSLIWLAAMWGGDHWRAEEPRLTTGHDGVTMLVGSRFWEWGFRQILAADASEKWWRSQ